MEAFEIVLVAAFAVAAITNWFAVDTRTRPDGLITVSKLGATGLLLALAAFAGDLDGAARTWLVIAVVCCFAGDAFLLGDSETRFLAGLGSFAAGHLGYVVVAVLVGVSWPRLLLAVPFLVALLGYRFLARIVPGAGAAGGPAMAGAVLFYAAVISTMVVTATGSPHWAAAVGAMTFAVSDWCIGYARFVRPFAHHHAVVMATYHVGQIALVAGLLAA